MKFLAYKDVDIEKYGDEIEHIKDHIEVVYQHVKDYLDHSDLLFTLPDDDSQDVFSQLFIRTSGGIGELLIVRVIIKEPSQFFKNNAKEHFVDTILDDIFLQWDIDVRYMENTFEEVISWGETKEV